MQWSPDCVFDIYTGETHYPLSNWAHIHGSNSVIFSVSVDKQGKQIMARN